MLVTGSYVWIVLMNMSNCTNSALSDNYVTKDVERMFREAFENTIGTVVRKNEYCVFALLNTIGRPLRADAGKSVRTNRVDGERRRELGNFLAETIAVRNSETASRIRIGIRITGTGLCTR